MPVLLMPTTSKISTQEVLEFARSHVADCQSIIVADAYVTGAETWRETRWGWQTDIDEVEITNVDHHAPSARMYRPISSGNLATKYVDALGPASKSIILINHCDCDSIVSSNLLSGDVAPCQELEDAVIAADHTGVENLIADHLQALEPLRDLSTSNRTLLSLVTGTPLADDVNRLWQMRCMERQRWQVELSQPGIVHWHHTLALIESDQRVPAEMLSSLLPSAALIITSQPAESDGQPRWIMKVRLGMAAHIGFTLNQLPWHEIDPAFGGRWNAGSNKRGRGTTLDPREYAARLYAIYSRILPNV